MSELHADPMASQLRLLLVEDEALVAMAMEDMLSDLDCVVVDVAGTLAQALDRIDHLSGDIDAAILDVNLGGERVYPAADALAAKGVPFMFATGYGPEGLDDRYPQATVLAKPVLAKALAGALNRLRGASDA